MWSSAVKAAIEEEGTGVTVTTAAIETFIVFGAQL